MPLFPSELNVSFEEFEREAHDFANPTPTHTCQTNPAVIVINAPSEVCQKAWVEHVWTQGGGMGTPRVLRSVPDKNGQGNIRTPGYGLFELIMEVNLQTKLIEYCIPRGLPLSSHHASVYFEPQPDGSTRVAWIVRYTPLWYGKWFGFYCEKVLFPYFLRNLKSFAESNKHSTDKQ